MRWRGFGLPASMQDAVDAVREAFDRSAMERVEVSCAGGIGRTGTALALMSVMAGIPVGDAVGWVRTHHHRRAVETRGQRRWVHEAAALL